MLTFDKISKRFNTLVVLAILLFAHSPAALSVDSNSLSHIDALIRKQKYVEAIRLASAIEKRFPGSVELSSRQAVALMYAGDNSAAIKKSKLVLKKDPENYEAHWVLSNVYSSMGMMQEGFEEYQQSVKFKNRAKNICKSCLEKSKKFQQEMDRLIQNRSEAKIHPNDLNTKGSLFLTPVEPRRRH